LKIIIKDFAVLATILSIFDFRDLAN